MTPGSCSGCFTSTTREAPVSEQYAGPQIVGMDLHRRRSVLVRMTETGERLETVRISNDPEYLKAVMLVARGMHGGPPACLRLEVERPPTTL